MSNSNITKHALAYSLKELMQTKPLDKITIGEICDQCGMNRKSFYYHFKDKYFLVNWIFNTEFVPLVTNAHNNVSSKEKFDLLVPSMEYLYENKIFYRNALEVKGPNSFYEHMREFLLISLKDHLRVVFEDRLLDEFTINFFADAIFAAIQRWLSEEDCMTADEFLKKVYDILYYGSNVVQERFNEDEEI